MVVTSEPVAFLGGLKLMDFVSETDGDALCSRNKSSRAATATTGTRVMHSSRCSPAKAPQGRVNSQELFGIVQPRCHSQHWETFGKVDVTTRRGGCQLEMALVLCTCS